jgi:hypothetical protein
VIADAYSAGEADDWLVRRGTGDVGPFHGCLDADLRGL